VSSGQGARLVAIDVARGVAVLLMIQTHAYDGWARTSERAGPGFQLTRVLGTLPLPMFLLLAGLGVALRADAARRRDEQLAGVRSDMLVSGLRILGTGYALSIGYALMDGARAPQILLRADVLHTIGLSLAIMALAGLGRFRSLSGAGAALTLLPVLVCPFLTRLGAELSGPSRYLWALLIDVPDVTRMPVVPLLSFCATGSLLGLWLVRSAGQASPAFGRALCGLGAILLCLGLVGTVWVKAQGIPMSRAHFSIVFNVLDLDGRAFVAIGLSLIATPWLGRARPILSACGRHSLFIYGLHLPFCYGAPSRMLKRALSMQTASLLVLLLCAACIAAALGLGHLQHARSKRLS